MRHEFIPLLDVQGEHQGLPRSMYLFRQSLRMISNPYSTELELVSLVWMNPMGKNRVTPLTRCVAGTGCRRDRCASRA
jgi:hypothetical protein